MFKDYFIQMLTATAPQVVHPISPILAYPFQHFSNADNIKTLANVEGEKNMLSVLLIKCVRSNRYIECKLVDKVKKLNVNKSLFCVKKGKIWNIF